jgi:hypothetical protein
MHTQQDSPVAFPISFRPEAIFTVLRNIAKRMRKAGKSARDDGVASGLGPQLRYDIGEIDYIPKPVSPDDSQSSYQQSPEVIWLRYFLK